jgi:hypothetical protein
MLVANLNSNSNLAVILITKIDQWEIVKDKLIPLIEVVLKYVSSIDLDSIIEWIKHSVNSNNQNFGLWVVINKLTFEVNSYCITTIIEDDDGKKVCLVYHFYVNPKNFLTLFKEWLPLIYKWASLRGCSKIRTAATHKSDVIARILARYNWKVTKTIIEREI